MQQPRREALTWALKLFRDGKTREEMDASVARCQKDKDPRAYAVSWCWTSGREWVNERLKAGKNYADIEQEVAQASSQEDKRLAPVRTTCLTAIKTEGHTTPQPAGCESDAFQSAVPVSAVATAMSRVLG